METIYIAVNGDDVGKGIGNAIASDDHETLGKLSQSVKDSHGMVEDWVQKIGGRVVTSSGDEGIYQIPSESLGELENIRSQYQKMSENTMTVGVGDSMSEASKALIYGKLNDKNQIVHYDPHIEDFLSSEEKYDDEEDDIPASDELEENIEYDNIESEGGEETTEMPEEEAVDEHEELVDTLESGDEEDLDEEASKQSDELESYKEEVDEPEHEEDMGAEEELFHDAAENEADEIDSDNVEADEEATEFGIDGKKEDEEDFQEIPNEEIENEMDEGINGKTDEEEGEISELSEEDIAPNDLEEENDEDGSGMLTDMIHGHLQSEEGMPEEGMSEEGMEVDSEENDAAIREDIARSLLTFKENKHVLEEAQSSNPELYEATITMLRNMIEMARKLGYSPDEQIEGMEAEDQLQQDFPENEQPEEEIPEEALGKKQIGKQVM